MEFGEAIEAIEMGQQLVSRVRSKAATHMAKTLEKFFEAWIGANGSLVSSLTATGYMSGGSSGAAVRTKFCKEAADALLVDSEALKLFKSINDGISIDSSPVFPLPESVEK